MRHDLMDQIVRKKKEIHVDEKLTEKEIHVYYLGCLLKDVINSLSPSILHLLDARRCS